MILSTHIKLYDNEKFEEMIREWAYFYLQEKSGKYKRVQRLGGAGDRGRDVIGYLDTKSSAPSSKHYPWIVHFWHQMASNKLVNCPRFRQRGHAFAQVRTAIVKLAKTFPMRRLSDHCAGCLGSLFNNRCLPEVEDLCKFLHCPTATRGISHDLATQPSYEDRLMADKTIILIFRGEDHRNIRDHVHFGDLLSPLTEPLEHSRIDGHLRVSFQRTHEWEAELLLHWLGAGAVAGGSAVAAGVCTQFGAKIADLIWKWATSHVKQMRVNDKHIQSSQELASAPAIRSYRQHKWNRAASHHYYTQISLVSAFSQRTSQSALPANPPC